MSLDIHGAYLALSSADDIEDKYSSWRSPRIWKWIKSEPVFSGIDLRDYFWLSRSSITDTLSGVRLLSQAMRQCVDALLSDSQPLQVRNGYFVSLSEDEQSGVIAMVAKMAMRDPANQTPLGSLLDLALAGSVTAAEAFRSSVTKIGASQLSPGLGVKLRSAPLNSKSAASEIVIDVISALAKTETRIGRALKLKKPKK